MGRAPWLIVTAPVLAFGRFVRLSRPIDPSFQKLERRSSTYPEHRLRMPARGSHQVLSQQEVLEPEIGGGRTKGCGRSAHRGGTYSIRSHPGILRSMASPLDSIAVALNRQGIVPDSVPSDFAPTRLFSVVCPAGPEIATEK